MTRIITFFFLLAVPFHLSAQAPKKASPDTTNPTARTLMSLENQWVAALEKADTATLDSILADTYVDTDEQGHLTDKQAVFSVLKSGDLKFDSVKVRDLKVHAYGNAAVVTGIGVQKGNFKGRPLDPTVAFTDTFIRQNGKWRAVASHRSTTEGALHQ